MGKKRAYTVLIIGADEEALKIIHSLNKSDEVIIAGVVDPDDASPGIRLAKTLGIPTGSSSAQFLEKSGVDTIINFSGGRLSEEDLLARRTTGQEIIGESGAGLIGALAESISSAVENEHHSVFQNMLSGVAYHKILSDSEGNPVDYVFLDVNRSFERLIGLSKEKIIGQRVTEVFPWIKHSMFNWIDFYGKVATSGKEVKFEQYLSNLDRWYSVSAYSTKKGFFITIYNDITELREKEIALRRAYESLKSAQDQLIQTEKMEIVGRLASGVAHEVKNPLAVLQQGIDFFYKRIKDPENDMLFVLNAMRDAAKRATGIIHDLSDFSRASNMEIRPEDVNSIIEQCLLLVEPNMKANRVTVHKEIGEGLPRVKLDRNRIQQVFINLFMNAIQAMPSGGTMKIISKRKDRGSGDKILVIVEDAGGGISESILGKLFDPFFTTKDVGKGTGLGLSIVKSIVEGHSGTITVENKKDKSGVRVIVEL
ncbi:MAG: ATP-binding protein [Candidatus Omnitrophota bacterium]